MRDLLRPPPHRGPLIAAGAVVLTVGIALEELRLRDEAGAGVHLAVLAAAAALVLILGLQAPNEGGRPPAYQSVLLVTGLLLLYGALLRLADALGADGLPAGALAWTGTVQALVATYAAARRRSAVCLLVAAIAAGIALLAAFEWIFDPDGFTAARWLLLALALGLVLVALALRAHAPRHAELLIAAAGLAILVIGVQGIVSVPLGLLAFGDPRGTLPDFWELVVLGAGCGLVAFGAVDRSPGPAWLGVANLLVFVLAAGFGEASLSWWPLILLLLGGGAMAAGLRPRSPLPPEPDAYPAGDRPLASRTAEDEVVVRVRDESPAPRGSFPER